jgi:hypothetical protein
MVFLLENDSVLTGAEDLNDRLIDLPDEKLKG